MLFGLQNYLYLDYGLQFDHLYYQVSKKKEFRFAQTKKKIRLKKIKIESSYYRFFLTIVTNCCFCKNINNFSKTQNLLTNIKQKNSDCIATIAIFF
jgi:hypothetical protein